MSEIDPRFNPAYQPGFDPSKHSPVAAMAPAAVPLVEDEPVSVDQPDPAPAAITAVRRRNPVLIALWVLSALFVASGIYGLQLIGDRVAVLGDNGGFGGADYYLLQSYVILAPLLIALGLATAVGTLFVFAVRWRKD
jgi:hypothetical protein